jgi:hypothetical protein
MQTQFRNNLEWREFRQSANEKNVVQVLNEFIQHQAKEGIKINDLNRQLKKDLPALAKSTATSVVSSASGSSSGTATTSPVQGDVKAITYTGSPIFVIFQTPFQTYCNGGLAHLFFTNPDGSPGDRETKFANYTKDGFYVTDLEAEITNVTVSYTAFGG